MKLTCPIRGELNVQERARDGLTYTEEYQRIELVKFLLSKGYPSELFDFEKNVWDIGNSGRNHLRADLVIYNNLREKKIVIICEVKRDHRDKENAINQQLNPECIHNQPDFGIYFDGVENGLFIKDDNFHQEYSLLKLPIHGYGFNDNPLKYDDLIPLEDVNSVIDKLDQLLHNVGATKEIRYKELFKIIKAKYYDEKTKDGTDDLLDFQVTNNTVGELKELYENAKSYYEDNSREEIEIPDEIVVKIVKLLQNYGFTKSEQGILQALFMKFAQSTLRTELDQFYTPISVTEFVTSLIKIKNTTKIIDPAGGSADFLVSCLKKNINSANNVYYWDKSDVACDVAKLNMILNGDGRTHISLRDTIESWNKSNGQFDLVITNPPFGVKTIFEGRQSILDNYELYSESGYKQLGVLYLEKCMNLLKPNGNLLIIVPNGYMTNPTDTAIRDFLFKKYRVVGFISLPEGTFKQANTGVKTGVLIVKKQRMNSNYKIFTDVAINIGFDYHSKDAEKLYVRLNNGDYKLDGENHKIPLSDFPSIIKKFKKFAYDSDLNDFENENNNEKYDYLTYNEINDSEIKMIRPETNKKIYLDTVKEIKRGNYMTLSDCDISNEKSFTSHKTDQYCYIDIKRLEKGNYLLDRKLYGWELPNRAKIAVQKNDIILSKLSGSVNKFTMILSEDTRHIVVTNGCFRVRIADERKRLSFYRFLFSKEYEIQMNALATGSIMPDVKEEELKNNLYFPKLSDTEFRNMKEFIRQQEFFVKLRGEF